MNLFKVKVETEIMVMAENQKQAIEIAKKNAVNEASYGQGTASKVTNSSEIPEEWRYLLPYAPDGHFEHRQCIEIVSAKNKDKKELPEDEIKAIIDVKEKSEGKSKAEQVEELKPEKKPETRPDPKPKELNWQYTDGKPLLRFVK